VVSTAADAALTIADPSTTANGHLVNGSFSLPAALKVGGSTLPATVKAWSTPVSNENVPLNFTQAIGANDSLRTGVYAKTLTLTLSTTNPQGRRGGRGEARNPGHSWGPRFAVRRVRLLHLTRGMRLPGNRLRARNL
jgi:hypothetical protein